MVAQTSGCQSRTWGREAVEDDEEACGMVAWPGGGRSAVVDDDLRGRRRWHGERRLPTSLASNSGCKLVLLDEGTMVVPQVRSDGDGMGWWWPVTVNTSLVEESNAEAVVIERERRQDWEFSTGRPRDR
jgi:hypothetical protein